MKNRKSPLNILIGILLIILSIIMWNIFFGREEPFFTNTRAGSVIGIAAACILVFGIGVSRITIYLWSLLPNKNESNNSNKV